MKCDKCIVKSTCTRKFYDGTLCDEIFKEITERIENLRLEAEKLESEYGLSLYYLQERTKGRDPAEVHTLLEKGYNL